MIIQICIGSSCHLKGSERLVELFQDAIKDSGYYDEITLAGSFCTGRCNREGVTITVDDDIYTGVTPENLTAFFEDNVMKKLKAQEA